MAQQPLIGIRREDKGPWERRVALTPDHVRDLVQAGVGVVVQPSEHRVFPDDDYAAVFDINVRTNFEIIRSASSVMTRGGRIITITATIASVNRVSVCPHPRLTTKIRANHMFATSTTAEKLRCT